MRRTIAGAFYLLLGLLINLAFLSCSRAVPQIQNYTLRLIYHETALGIQEQLSLFVIAQDEDGNEDLDSLYIIHDEAQLYWTLTSSDWLTVTRDKQLWVGSNSIAMIGGEPLPRGLYRLILTDKGGERAERSIGLDAPIQSRYPFPRIQIQGDRFVVSSLYPKNTLLCYDGEGTMIQSIPLANLSGSLKGLKLPPAVVAIALWSEDSDAGLGALTRTVSIQQ